MNDSIPTEQRGKVIASCGHEIPDVVGFAVKYHGETRACEPCIVYATYCRSCTALLVLEPEFISAEYGPCKCVEVDAGGAVGFDRSGCPLHG